MEIKVGKHHYGNGADKQYGEYGDLSWRCSQAIQKAAHMRNVLL